MKLNDLSGSNIAVSGLSFFPARFPCIVLPLVTFQTQQSHQDSLEEEGSFMTILWALVLYVLIQGDL